jgi:hypothetical protein
MKMKEIGVAKANAYNQEFLDACEAVSAWIESCDGQYFIFEYDPEVEVPYVPSRNIWFQRDQAPFAGHVHRCLNCDSMIAAGEFDCESNNDHDYALCPACVRD